ncbi:hypothetical protein [Xinfangfangia pollutisoli]|uniref:hypothetical protein n=1 Tax=Xinfangfangia pollutisoli TaxID=2865960 RepID=UPI001CD4B429|nr:hypothetical protein [Xinfangfangia pollutisoli]
MAVYYTPGYAQASDQPMTHARILWRNLAGTISASSAAEGRAAGRAGQVDTASWWQPQTAPAWWRIDYAAPQIVDAVGVAAHQLDGVTVRVEALVAGAWVQVAEGTPPDRSAILLLFPAVAAAALRLRIDRVAPIGVIYTGQALAMPRAGYAALGMLDLRRTTTLTSYVSEGGQLLKRYIQRGGLSGPCEWRNLPEDWYRASFDPFARAARTEPFFLASRPKTYAEDCVYGWVDASIVPQRQGMGNLVSVGFEVQAVGHE